MPRNASGNFTLPAVYRATPGTTIRSDQHNTPLEDIAQALTDSLPRNGTAPMTGNLPMGGRRITGLGEAVEPTDALRRDQAVLSEGTQAYGRSLLNTASAAAAQTLLNAVPAGRFLTGGAGMVNVIGNLSENRTIAMGTPSGITATSTNAATGETHSHALTNADFRQIHANAIRSANLVGSLMFALFSGAGEVLYGQEISGSLLRPASNNNVQPVSSITGRWVCLGYADGSSITLFIKVSD